MDMYGGVKLNLLALLSSELDGGEWSTAHPSCYIQGKNPRYSLDRRLGGPQSWSGHGGKEKIPVSIRN